MNLNLNISDITDAVAMIDHAAEQGAFKGWPLIRQTLIIRDRLVNFINAANAAQQQLNTPAAVLHEADQPVQNLADEGNEPNQKEEL